MMRPLQVIAVGVVLAALTACGGGSPQGDDADDTAVLDVAAAFYPLELAVERIGGERVRVTTLTKPGAEPHDVELTPREVGRLSTADLVVYLGGFQPAVDDAVASTAADAGFDITPSADLTLAATDDGHDHSGESAEEHAEHGDAEPTDPHFWLDPTRYATVADAIADRLAELDPEGAADYAAAAATFTAELATLDEELAAALSTCRHRDLVTGHAAFGYLADRYDLHQVGIAGLTPESEPTAAQIRDLVTHIRETGVTTVYAETLSSAALAETVAREAGVKVKVLDPLEGISDASSGGDYFEVMRANVAILQEGQGCGTP